MAAERSLPVWRSLLSVPVNVERFVEKAHLRGADCILLDLENSVPMAEKAHAAVAPMWSCGSIGLCAARFWIWNRSFQRQ